MFKNEFQAELTKGKIKGNFLVAKTGLHLIIYITIGTIIFNKGQISIDNIFILVSSIIIHMAISNFEHQLNKKNYEQIGKISNFHYHILYFILMDFALIFILYMYFYKGIYGIYLVTKNFEFWMFVYKIIFFIFFNFVVNALFNIKDFFIDINRKAIN